MSTTYVETLDGLDQSHKLATLVEVVDGTSGGVVETLGISDGSVTIDSTAAVRRTCELTVVDDGTLGLVPTDAFSALAPYGNEVRISRGVERTNGDVELVRLGVFRIEKPTVSDTGESLEIRLSGMDRAKPFIDAVFEEPYQVASGTNVITAIEDVLTLAYPSTVMDFPTTTYTTPLLVAQEAEDRWAFAQGLATFIASELYFDADGTLVLRQIAQDPTPVATFAEGEGGLLLEATADWDRENAKNKYIVSGENPGETGTIPRGEAYDDDPDSPTYYGPPFGRNPDFYASEFVTSDTQAADAAAALLAKNLGVTKSIDFGVLVDPTLDAGDAVTITRERLGVSSEVHIIDQLQIPLTAEGTMSGKTRAVRVIG